MRRLVNIVVVLALAWTGQAQESGALKTRLWADLDSTRLVLEYPTALNYKVTSDAARARLVVDIDLPAREAARIDTSSLARAAMYITAIRTERISSQTLRVIFELAAPVDYKVLRIKPVGDYKQRLVFDILPQNPHDPLGALIEALVAGEEPPFVVLLDPGHGGEDPGAVSKNGRYEKDIVLSIAKKTAKRINEYPQMKAVLTREHDRFIKLFDRVGIAHRVKADLFISIHADSVESSKPRGSSVFVLSEKGATTKYARRLARDANLADLIGGEPSVRDPVEDLALRAWSKDGKDRASREIASAVLANLGKINHLHSTRVEAAGFAVLKSPSIPSVLVETAFISNPEEEKKLLNPAHQEKIAQAIAQAAYAYKQKFHIAK